MAMHMTSDDLMMIRQLRTTGVRVGVTLQEPWAYECGLTQPLSVPGGDCPVPGIGIELTASLCEMLGIPCSFIRLNYTASAMQITQVSGEAYQMDYQEWIKGEIVGGDIDTSVPNIIRTTSNLDQQLLDFTQPMFYMKGGALVRKSVTAPGRLMFKPFQPLVWFLLLGVLLFAIAYDMMCRAIIRHVRKTKNAAEKSKLAEAVFINFGILSQRSVNIEANAWSRRMIYATLGMSSIVICGTYGAFLVGQRVANRVELPFESFSQLVASVESGSYRLLVDQFASHLLTKVDSAGEDEVLYARLKTAFQDKVKRPEFVYNMTEAINMIGTSNENIALFSSFLALSAASRDNCNVTVIPLNDLEEQGNFAFRKKNYPYSKLFFKGTLSFKEKGDFFEQQELKYRFKRQCAPDFGVNQEAGVSLHSLDDLFMFVVIGLTAGVIAFIVELLYYNEIAPRAPQAGRSLVLSTVPYALTPALPGGMNNRIVPFHDAGQEPVSGISYDPRGPELDDFQKYWVFGQPVEPVWHLRPDGELLYYPSSNGNTGSANGMYPGLRKRKVNKIRLRHRSGSC